MICSVCSKTRIIYQQGEDSCKSKDGENGQPCYKKLE